MLDDDVVSEMAVSSQPALIFTSSLSSWAGCSAASVPLVNELASSPDSIASTTACSGVGLSSGGSMHRSNPNLGRARTF